MANACLKDASKNTFFASGSIFHPSSKAPFMVLAFRGMRSLM